MSDGGWAHWEAEVERVRDRAGSFAPAASFAVQAVLHSIVAEPTVPPRVAASAASLLHALLGGADAEAPQAAQNGDRRSAAAHILVPGGRP